MKATFKSCCIRCVLHNTDGDGRTLAQEIFNDSTSPFQPNQPSVLASKQNQFQSSTEDMEIEI